MSKGLVIKNTGSLFLVQLEDGTVVETSLRGRFRLKGIRSTNPVVVGDVVRVDGERISYFGGKYRPSIFGGDNKET